MVFGDGRVDLVWRRVRTLRHAFVSVTTARAGNRKVTLITPKAYRKAHTKLSKYTDSWMRLGFCVSVSNEPV